MTQQNKLLECELSMIVDAVMTFVSAVGAMLSHFWSDNCDWFLICGMVSCFSFYNFADSHDKYTELKKERNKDN